MSRAGGIPVLQAGRTSNGRAVPQHTTPAYFEFNRRIVEHGLRHALAWRDGPFKESRQFAQD
jgi:hypothetical protein